MENILWLIVAIVLLYLIVKILRWPFKILGKLIVNGVLGFILLLLINYIGNIFSISIEINVVSSLIAGFFGIPGVIFLIIFSKL